MQWTSPAMSICAFTSPANSYDTEFASSAMGLASAMCLRPSHIHLLCDCKPVVEDITSLLQHKTEKNDGKKMQRPHSWSAFMKETIIDPHLMDSVILEHLPRAYDEAADNKARAARLRGETELSLPTMDEVRLDLSTILHASPH